MKKITILILVTINLFGWETNTHRAINKTAIQKSQNLTNFLNAGGLKNYVFKKDAIAFDGYNATYIEYIVNKDKGEENGVSKWSQTFTYNQKYTYTKKATVNDLIEAGTILEDALWQDEDKIVLGGDGRFNNHFYESQNGGKKLTWGYGFHVNAVEWATDVNVPTANPNLYNYPRAMRYFKLGFTESDPAERRKYQAKMLVSVGHLMHLVNDMNVPSHVRDDAHPFDDPLEVWMRGGQDGKNTDMGFHVMGSEIEGNVSKDMGTIHNQSTAAKYMTAEAEFTSKNFVSKDTLYLDSNTYLPNSNTIRYGSYINVVSGLRKRYIYNQHGTKIAIDLDSYLCRNIKIIYYQNSSTGREVGLCGAPTSIRGDYSVLEDSGRVLIKRAIANATGFVNYFFRGQISAEITNDEIIVTNNSDTSLLANENTANLSLHGALYPYQNYRLMYEDDDGTRHPLLFQYNVPELDGSIAYIGSVEYPPLVDGFYSNINVPSNHSIKVPITLSRETRSLIRNKKIIVIFDGNIGSERGISVCYASNKLLVTGTRE